MERIGLSLPRSGFARSLDEARTIVRHTGYPAIIRPSFTLGGTGGSVAYNPEELEGAVRWGLQMSPVGSVLIEESIIGWKEFELEVMRDLADNVVIICSIENFDPMGVHTGDSITVAPAQTLTDKEYQLMRDAAVADHPRDRRRDRRLQHPVRRQPRRRPAGRHRDEPARLPLLGAGLQGHRASPSPRSPPSSPSATASTRSATTSPGRRRPPSSPCIDYCVVKIPRWAFEKFPEADRTLTTQMKSVGEVMAIGRTFKEALQKAVRSLEQDRCGLTLDRAGRRRRAARAASAVPNPDRLFAIGDAYRAGTGDRRDPRR